MKLSSQTRKHSSNTQKADSSPASRVRNDKSFAAFPITGSPDHGDHPIFNYSITKLPTYPILPIYLFLDLATASRVSFSAVRRRSVSRLSQLCLPLASATSHLILPFLKYILVGTSV